MFQSLFRIHEEQKETGTIQFWLEVTLRVSATIIHLFARKYVCNVRVAYVYRFLNPRNLRSTCYTQLIRLNQNILNHNMQALNNPNDESSCLQCNLTSLNVFSIFEESRSVPDMLLIQKTWGFHFTGVYESGIVSLK